MGPLRKLKNLVGKDNKPLNRDFEEKGIIAVLQFNAHCRRCSFEVKKCCKNMSGVLSAELEEGNPEMITVKGVFEVEKLVKHIRRQADKVAKIVRVERVGGGGGERDADGGERAAEEGTAGEAAAGAGEGASTEEDEEITSSERGETSHG